MKITKHQFEGNGKIQVGYTVSNKKYSFFVHPENYDEHYNDTVIDQGNHLLHEATEMYLNHNFTNGVTTLEQALKQEIEWNIKYND
jgi:hypothetical protein